MSLKIIDFKSLAAYYDGSSGKFYRKNEPISDNFA